MKRLIVKGITAALLAAALAFPLASQAFADQNPNGTGQPSQSCQAQPSSPGQAASNSGSPFAGGQADNVYAGNPGTASSENANSMNAVSQYDVACFQVSQP